MKIKDIEMKGDGVSNDIEIQQCIVHLEGP